jgi:stearoyl-CoA desaturase (delta-9 desaturase)
MTHFFVQVLVAIGIGFIVTTLANTATTVYLHRSLSHRGLTLRAPASMFFRAVIWLTTGIKPRQWVAVHRKHHAFTDEDGDPHSPVLLGWRTVQAKNVALYRKALADPAILDRYARDPPTTGGTACSSTTRTPG